jgi:hypothetical protein
MQTRVIAALALLALRATAANAATGPGLIAPHHTSTDTPFVASLAAAQEDQRGVDVRVWTEDERDAFSSGDRTRVFVRTNAGAYVAVLHIDTSGNLEVLFPGSPYEDGFLQARRLYAVPLAGTRYWTVRGAPGVGYVFAVASDQPLELRSIRGLFAARAGAGDHVVYGDPFASMMNIARVLVPDWSYVGHAVDWWGYSLGGRYSYPRYACYDAYGSWYYGRGAQYDSCERVRLTLRDDPNYYDTRYHRADRRSYADQRDAARVPAYGYKEAPGGTTERYPTTTRPGYDAGGSRTSRGRSDSGSDPAPAPRQNGTTRTADPPSERPTLQRRESGGERQEPRSSPPPASRGEPRVEPPPRSEPRAQPAPAPPPGDAAGPASSGMQAGT